MKALKKLQINKLGGQVNLPIQLNRYSNRSLPFSIEIKPQITITFSDGCANLAVENSIAKSDRT